jgi:uracil-DNA glycosylase
MLPPIPISWKPLLQAETEKPYFRQLDAFLDEEIANGEVVLPPANDIFNALRFTAHDEVKVVLLGQDPYPKPGDAHGLCFSVRPNVPVPASLRNVYKELHDDVGFRIPNNGYLEPWAKQGMLMLNTALTVRAHAANSHQGHHWDRFTDLIIRLVNDKPTRVVFLLWGKEAQKKSVLITQAHHKIIRCAHPSPLSAPKFFGCRCFSAANQSLTEAGLKPIDWQIPDIRPAYFAFQGADKNDQFVIRIDDQEMIGRARAILSGKETQAIHVQGTVIQEKAPYNPKWSYHLAPASIGFFEWQIEVCDANMRYVEEHLSEVGGAFLPKAHWCPWASRLVKELPDFDTYAGSQPWPPLAG